MNLDNKNQQEIQQQIFDELKKGTSVESLKAELKEKGLHPEGYYFTSEAAYQQIKEAPKSAASNVSAWQIIVTIIAVIVMVIRIARCSNRM